MWWGRCKLLLKPSHWQYILDPHSGFKGRPNITKGQIHLDTSEAHVKEWPSIFKVDKNITMRAPESFIVYTTHPNTSEALQIHNFPRGHKYIGNDKTKLMVYHDDQLQNWLEYVKRRRSIQS